MFRSFGLASLLGALIIFASAAASAQTFNCAIPQDRVDRLLGDLSNITNLTDELGCRKDDACIVLAVLKQVAKEEGLPEGLVFAVAWTESNWQQWDNRGRTVVGGGADFGIMQINRRAHGHKYDWNQISHDPLYNARAGGDILKWSYNYARSKGYRGMDLWKATYAVYNGGPRAVHRPWNTSSRFRLHDSNFSRHMNGKPWTSRTRNCGTPRVAARPTVTATPSPSPWLTPVRSTPPRRQALWSLLRYFLWA